mmetsp:Transcript_4609/g.9208  ORF Transcript_4609/g.9208 Transcript_4609/m.9208 type:complete len:327 (-) Transcript_4609:300-1280(-)|eukprot:CAMPEP_0181308770 /NCGR_PEP_ID=MMETSP1101-20121128/11652_1 /TAXON_ID=46948 /ORGANISM="Rhodomonas abbreviata, Strain Caron Lab Isolate" /LENGTH=326 /DNA_ID=CAMNT_0023415199 /DNA_START=66 /DNA_END=1046 /DNA_ORIENTATION=-
METYISRQPMQELPAFRDQVENTYTSTYTHYYKVPVVPYELSEPQHPKAPLNTQVDYVDEPVGGFPPSKPTTRTWGRSSDIIGTHPMGEALKRAEAKIENAMIDTAALEAPMQTEAPMTEISTSHYFHGPMPDRAITQHFLHRRTTSSVVDGSGGNQVVEVPIEDADPNFYYLRDADGSRRVLEVLDKDGQPPLRAQGRSVDEVAQECREERHAPAVRYKGHSSCNNSTFVDQSAGAEEVRRRAAGIEEARRRGTGGGGAKGEMMVNNEKRITVPHVFTHINGIPTTDRHTEIKMKTMPRDPNPPRASLSQAYKLIYSSAPPPEYD